MGHRSRKATKITRALLMLIVQEGFPVVAYSFQQSSRSPVLFPGIEERMNILALGVVLLGGLIFLLNRLRQKSDRRSEETNK